MLLSTRTRSVLASIFFAVCGLVSFHTVHSFSNQQAPPPKGFSRRDVVELAILGAAGAAAVGKIIEIESRKGAYPAEHEQKVQQTITETLLEAAKSKSSSNQEQQQPQQLRVLEVGIGNECRSIRRGLYDQAIEELSSLNGIVKGLDLTGVDIEQLPSEVEDIVVQIFQTQTSKNNDFPIEFHPVTGDLTSTLPFQDGEFDAVVCFLTLCSVTEPQKAVTEMKRLVKPNGGTFGYVEHIAIDPIEAQEKLSAKLFDVQQTTLDPLQQLVAHNCHLHRYSEDTIMQSFGTATMGEESIQVQRERFFVNDMWPVCMQCRGVIQRVPLV